MEDGKVNLLPTMKNDSQEEKSQKFPKPPNLLESR
jgi:hypothetical protein